MFVHLVRFTSALSEERIQQLFEARAREYAAVPGLLQKYYLRYQNGRHGGIYLWDSPQSMQAFRAGELSRSICDVYRVQESTFDTADVVLVLRPEAEMKPADHSNR
jgi:heme-degrading monooxygenase HmoA